MKKFIKTERGFREIEDKEESELEEDLEEGKTERGTEVVEIDNLKEFMKSKKVGPPVLERKEQPRQIIRLERGVGGDEREDIGNENNGDSTSTYIPKQTKEEVKYIEGANPNVMNPVRTDFTQLGMDPVRERRDRFEQSSFFVQAESWRGNAASTDIEKYTAPERFEIESAGRENPFRREEKKYDLRPHKH